VILCLEETEPDLRVMLRRGADVWEAIVRGLDRVGIAFVPNAGQKRPTKLACPVINSNAPNVEP
jgi:hypothetical protein